MANINKIRLSGTTYNIEDENASRTVELTQAQYDALQTKDPNTYYVITDATAADITNYYDKTETDDLLDEKADTATTYTKTEVDAALATKQATLVSGTNIKTINNESILGEGNITIQGGGGSVTVDDALSTTSENPVQNKVITNALNSKGERLMWDMTASPMKYVQLRLQTGNTSISSANLNLGDYLQYGYPTSSALNITGLTTTTDFETHTGDTTIHVTSTEKTAWNGAATNASNAITALGGLKLVSLTQAQYDALSTKDASTIYFING